MKNFLLLFSCFISICILSSDYKKVTISVIYDSEISKYMINSNVTIKDLIETLGLPQDTTAGVQVISGDHSTYQPIPCKDTVQKIFTQYGNNIPLILNSLV